MDRSGHMSELKPKRKEEPRNQPTNKQPPANNVHLFQAWKGTEEPIGPLQKSCDAPFRTNMPIVSAHANSPTSKPSPNVERHAFYIVQFADRTSQSKPGDTRNISRASSITVHSETFLPPLACHRQQFCHFGAALFAWKQINPRLTGGSARKEIPRKPRGRNPEVASGGQSEAT